MKKEVTKSFWGDKIHYTPLKAWEAEYLAKVHKANCETESIRCIMFFLLLIVLSLVMCVQLFILVIAQLAGA